MYDLNSLLDMSYGYAFSEKPGMLFCGFWEFNDINAENGAR